MIIGVPKEIKNHEYRVGLIPAAVRAYIANGHEVRVQTGAGLGSDISDSHFVDAGATMMETADEIWSTSEMIVKVKEPVAAEYDRIEHGQLIYTYFHLAAVPELAEVLIEKQVSAVAYETIQLADGSLPLLHPMSEVAGKMAPQVGSACLQKEHGGRGVLLGGIPGVGRGKVVILGAGTVGANAAKIALGMGADVTILDVNIRRLNYLEEVFGSRLKTRFSDAESIDELVPDADLVIGAVLIAGAKAPQLINRGHLKRMNDGAVVVDVAVDQGGCIETCRPTTHEDPTFVVDGVVHYCVANMPGAVARTSTYGLNNVTRRYGITLANAGVEAACRNDPALMLGLNTHKGHCTHKAVADSLGYDYRPLT